MKTPFAIAIAAFLSVTAACSEIPTAPTPLTGPLATVAADSVTMEARTSSSTMLGGLDMDGYCQSLGKGYTAARVDAKGTWLCGSFKINMTDACRWQYGIRQVKAVQLVEGDPYTWRCYTT